MTVHEIKKFASRVIKEELSAFDISVQNIILFGSRAKGQTRPESDCA